MSVEVPPPWLMPSPFMIVSGFDAGACLHLSISQQMQMGALFKRAFLILQPAPIWLVADQVQALERGKIYQIVNFAVSHEDLSGIFARVNGLKSTAGQGWGQ